jgi:hypothetical protein
LTLTFPLCAAVSGTMREASSVGFRKIANFIFGNNTPAGAAAGAAAAAGGGKGESIAMTSPVRMELQAADSRAGDKIAMT